MRNSYQNIKIRDKMAQVCFKITFLSSFKSKLFESIYASIITGMPGHSMGKRNKRICYAQPNNYFIFIEIMDKQINKQLTYA